MNKSDAIFERIKTALSAKNDSEVAIALGIKQQSVTSARKREKIPPGWIIRVAVERDVSSDWLLFGIGTKELKTSDNLLEVDDDTEDGGPFLLKNLPKRAGSRLSTLLGEIIIKYEKELEKSKIPLTIELKAKLICMLFEDSITNRRGAVNLYMLNQFVGIAQDFSQTLKEKNTMIKGD